MGADRSSSPTEDAEALAQFLALCSVRTASISAARRGMGGGDGEHQTQSVRVPHRESAARLAERAQTVRGCGVSDRRRRLYEGVRHSLRFAGRGE